MKNNKSSQAGSFLIEFVIAFPIFLIIIAILFFIGIYINSMYSLTTAIGIGTRAAITRGNFDLIGQNHIPTINSFKANPSSLLAEKINIFASSEFHNGWQEAYNYDIQNVFGQDLQDLPSEYLYALVYTIQGIKKSVGKLKYPCDPDPRSNPESYSGCLRCRFINPDSKNKNEFFLPYNCNNDGVKCPAPSGYFAMICEYAPDNTLTNLITNLLSIILGPQNIPNFKITRYAFYNLSR